MKKFCFISLLFVFFAFHLHAQTGNGDTVAKKTGEVVEVTKSAAPPKRSAPEVPPEKAKPQNVPKIAQAITIDGRPDEEAWKTATVLKDFYQTFPGDNTAPSKPTEVLLMYDEKHFYIAFKCWDEKDKIRATVARRDEIFGEDNVRVWLDTYNDQRRAYVLGFNPLGIQQDGIYSEDRGDDYTVDIVMESKGVIEEWGWSVEVKIPFKSLRYSAGKGKFWGFNVARNIDRFNDEFDQWLPDDRNVSGRLVKHGRITGLDEIKYERTLEIVPSITLSQTSELVEANGVPGGRFVHKPIKQDIGVTLKYTLSPNVTLDAAINPDFAEIEADAPVVTANQRFPIFFPEKRPFFLEGKEIFDSPLQVFYSRRIEDPDFAAKLSGKIDKTSFGFMAASDKAPGNFSEDDRTRLRICKEIQTSYNPALNCPLEEFLDKNALFGVLRVKRDFGASNNVGFFGTARVWPQDRNFVGGFDGKFKLDTKTVMTFQAVGTHTREHFYDPVTNTNPYRTGNGMGYFWSLDYTTDKHGWYAEVFGRSSDYRADAGFTRRTNTNQAFFVNRFSTKSDPKAKFIRLSWNQFARYTFDWSGRIQYALAGMGVNGSMQGNTFFSFEAGDQYEKIYEEEFGPKRDPAGMMQGAFYGAPTRATQQPYFSFNAEKRFNKQFFMYGFVGSIFGAFDYDFGAGHRFPRRSPAYLEWVENGRQPPEPPKDPGPGWQFDANVGAEYKPVDPFRISLDYTKSQLTRNDNGEVAFDTNIFTLRSTYQFTRFIYIRARLDYESLSSQSAGQLLFGWNPSPGTAFYAGYNDSFTYNGFNPYSGQYSPRFERQGRTFFVRASYLFRKSI